MPEYNFNKSLIHTSPSDVEDNDAFAIRVVAVASAGRFWRAFRGPSSWPDQEVAGHGDEISEEAARQLFFALANSGRVYG